MSSSFDAPFVVENMNEQLNAHFEELEVECDLMGSVIKPAVFTDTNKDVIHTMFVDALTNPPDDDDFDEIYSFIQLIEDELCTHFIKQVSGRVLPYPNPNTPDDVYPIGIPTIATLPKLPKMPPIPEVDESSDLSTI